mgnify:FL=1
MSKGHEDIPSQPLVIVRRRRSNQEESHHGGVWKIAYADFMTAMMAFFLVMWLVNAADKKTIVQVAAYFNPIRLTDRTATMKGLKEIEESETKGSAKKGAKSKTAEKDVSQTARSLKEPADKGENGSESGAAGKASLAKEEAIYSEPMAALNKLADEAKTKIAEVPSPKADTSRVRDPFDPAQRKIAMAPTAPSVGSDPAAVTSTKKETAMAPGSDQKESKGVGRQEEARAIESEIKAALAHFSVKVPGIEVKSTPDGLLVSILDNGDFGMFAVGSAEPRPELVVIMEKVAGILKSRAGQIVVRGHTDGRAYRKGFYDNWRLSSARAHMAHYMLLRGGIDEKSIAAIEGRADRDLRVPSDKDAAQNRRIDILIRDQKP